MYTHQHGRVSLGSTTTIPYARVDTAQCWRLSTQEDQRPAQRVVGWSRALQASGKEYKRSHSMVHTSAVGLGSLSVGLSSGALATALTGFGIVASPALAGVATLCGLGSVGFAAASKRLERKVTKHEKIYTLAQAKRNSVNELVSKALADKQISDVEFHIITREVEKYHELKAAIRSGVKAVSQEAATQTQGPDIEKLKEELRKEVKKEFKKRSTFSPQPPNPIWTTKLRIQLLCCSQLNIT